MANTSAIWQQVSSPSCSTKNIQKNLTLNEKCLRIFLDHEQINDKTERVRGLGRKTREEMRKRNQMTALRFKTGDGASDFPGPPGGGGGGGGGETGGHSDCLCKVAFFFHVYRVYTDLSFSKTFFLSLSLCSTSSCQHSPCCLSGPPAALWWREAQPASQSARPAAAPAVSCHSPPAPESVPVAPPTLPGQGCAGCPSWMARQPNDAENVQVVSPSLTSQSIHNGI